MYHERMNYAEQLLEKLRKFKTCDKGNGETKAASVIATPKNDLLCVSSLDRIIQVSHYYIKSQTNQQTKAASITGNSKPIINEILQLKKFL